MNKADAKEFTIKHINQFFEENVFKLSKTRDSQVKYIRKTEFGFDGYASGTVDYNPIQIIRYSFFKRINIIEDIALEVFKRTKVISNPVDKNSLSLAFGYGGLVLGKYVDTYLPECSSENDIINCVADIIDFSKNHALPLIEKANNLKFLDNEINGENFWETDWQKKFNLGGNFDIKRLIIAKLADNPNFEEVVDKNYKAIEKASEESGYPFTYNRNDLSMPVPCVLEILKDVKPLSHSQLPHLQ